MTLSCHMYCSVVTLRDDVEIWLSTAWPTVYGTPQQPACLCIPQTAACLAGCLD